MADWRQILLAKHFQEANQIVQEQIADAAFTLNNIWDALLRCVGLTTVKAPLSSST